MRKFGCNGNALVITGRKEAGESVGDDKCECGTLSSFLDRVSPSKTLGGSTST